MAQVRVHGGDIEDGKIAQLRVKLHNLPARTIDRATTLHWLRDGHSFLPVIAGDLSASLQLVEVPDGDDVTRFIRADHAAEASDTLPSGLPSVAEAGV